MNDQEQGYVYVLINPSLEGLLKIGKTTRTPIERAKALSSATGVPTPFIVAYEKVFSDCSIAEQYVHTRLGEMGYRLSSNKEFFDAPLTEVINVIIEAESFINTSITRALPEVRKSISPELALSQDEPDNEEETGCSSDELEYANRLFIDAQYLLSLRQIDNEIMKLGFPSLDVDDNEIAAWNLLCKEIGDSLTETYVSITEIDMFDWNDDDDVLELLGEEISDDESIQEKNQQIYNISYYVENDSHVGDFERGLCFWSMKTAEYALFQKLINIKSSLSIEQGGFIEDLIDASSSVHEFKESIEDVGIQQQLTSTIVEYENFLSIKRKILKENVTDMDEETCLELRQIFNKYWKLRIEQPYDKHSWVNNNIINAQETEQIKKPWDELMSRAHDSRYGNKEEGVLQDLPEAERLYLSASKLGCHAALVALGNMHNYEEFEYFSKDEALSYYKEAMKKGNKPVCLLLAAMLVGTHEENAKICIETYMKRVGNLNASIDSVSLTRIYNFLFELSTFGKSEIVTPYLEWFSPIREKLLFNYERGELLDNSRMQFLNILDSFMPRMSGMSYYDSRETFEDLLDSIPWVVE